MPISVNFESKNYVKPQLDFEKYEWEWSELSVGIQENEIKEFKHFIRSVIPILSDHVRYIQVLESLTEKKKNLDKFQLGLNAFTPFISLEHIFGGPINQISYSVKFTWDEQIFVDREEHEVTTNNEVSYVNLKWELGQLFKK